MRENGRKVKKKGFKKKSGVTEGRTSAVTEVDYERKVDEKSFREMIPENGNQINEN